MNALLKINNVYKDLATWLDDFVVDEDEPIDKLLDGVYTNSKGADLSDTS